MKLSRQVVAPAITGVLSMGVGIIVGHILTLRSQKGDPHQLPDGMSFSFDPEQLAELRKNGGGKKLRVIVDEDEAEEGLDYNIEAIEDDEPTITEEEKQGLAQVDENISISIAEHVEEEEIEPVRRTIFAQNNEDWDMEKEMASRSPQQPYVLHEDEFHGKETDFHQYSYVYYEGDNILVDEDEVPVFNWHERIGDLEFGHGTSDPNVFHVRNEHRREEYEITRDDDHYARAVQHLEIDEDVEVEIRHSAIRRFRPDDG